MKQILLWTLSIFTIGMLNSGCSKKDNNTTTAPVTDSGQLNFHVHTNLGDEEVDDYNTVYTMKDNRKVSLSLAQFYISGIELVKTDGSVYTVPDFTLLKVLELESYVIANVPVGTYKSVRFKIGLDNATNSKDAAGNDLLNHPEMWFNTAAQPDGYVYLHAAGKIDTTTGATGSESQMQPFVYKIGTAAHYVEIDMPDHDPAYSITKGASVFVHLIFDYNQLFDGILLNNPANLKVSSKTDNTGPLSTQIANNIVKGFSYEE